MLNNTRVSLLSAMFPIPRELSHHLEKTLVDQGALNIADENRKKIVYKNVLSFPNTTSHLKYFEKNPHPDKIPDKLQAISDLFDNSSLNGDPYAKKLLLSMSNALLTLRYPNVKKSFSICRCELWN